jgi:hypothetical protein
MRNTLLALVAVTLAAAACPAQTTSWADKMFKDGTTHDFGGVPRGAQLFHRFAMTNIYAVPLQLLDVHTSCGCSTATPSTKLLQPREVGYIDVNMDGKRFTGPKTIRVYVTVGPQFTSTAELTVSANARADVVFNPGQVTFGVVTRGDTPTQTIDVEYAGALDWRVTGVNTNGAPFDVTLEEMYRQAAVPGQPGKAGYHAKFTLQAKVPAGALKQEVFLQTNDPASPLVPVLVEATVQEALTVSPNPVQVPGAQVGKELTRRVLVHGNGSKPFRILAVEGAGEGVSVATRLPTEQPQTQHTLILKCQPAKPGDFKRELRIKTDLQEAAVPVTVEGAAQP